MKLRKLKLIRQIILGGKNMNLNDYVDKRIKNEGISGEEFWEGYEDYKIGIFLKEARERSGLTQEELAKLMSVTQAYVSKIENQETVTPKMMQKVTKAITEND